MKGQGSHSQPKVLRITNQNSIFLMYGYKCWSKQLQLVEININ